MSDLGRGKSRIATTLGMCDCARTREYCLTVGCKKDKAEWRYTTEGRDEDHLRRIYDRRMKRPISRWLRPERAVAEAWLMNMEQRPVGMVDILKLGDYALDVRGVA